MFQMYSCHRRHRFGKSTPLHLERHMTPLRRESWWLLRPVKEQCSSGTTSSAVSALDQSNSSGCKYVSFQNLHGNHYTNASARALCVVIFVLIFLRKIIVPGLIKNGSRPVRSESTARPGGEGVRVRPHDFPNVVHMRQ